MLDSRNIAVDVIPIAARRIDGNDLWDRRTRMTDNRVGHLPFDVAKPNERIERFKAILPASKPGKPIPTRASWPQTLRIDRFVYDTIDGASAKGRLDWLRRNETGYSPQIYDQLAAVYRGAGHEEDTRRVLIAKQRRRFAQRNLAWKVRPFQAGGRLPAWFVMT
jgi:hypothetical protein